jgi:hypothetical protein
VTTQAFAAKVGAHARAMDAVQQHKPQHGEAAGRIQCPRCNGGLRFNIQSTGISRGNCSTTGCLRWCQ